VRGWTLPSYWIGSGFWISDWSSWGLSRPAAGYDWVRYYDDAVLVDRRGKVWDSVSGLDWDRDGHGYDEDERDDGYYAGRDEDRGYGADYAAPAYDESEYDRDVRIGHHDRREYRERREYRREHARPLRCIAHCYGTSVHAYGASGYYYGAPTTTTIVIQSAPVVTKTVVTEEVVYSTPRRVVRRVPSKTTLYRAPSKKLYRAPAKGR
jgi:hypothetical protein